MARTISDIYASVVYTLTENFSSVGITIDPTTWSKRNIMRVMCFSFATAAAYIEQLMDQLKASIETTASKTPAASTLWIQAKMFLFQYSSTVPQYVQLINTIPQYTTVDPTLRIITACSVTSNTPNEVVVKVAKTSGTDLVALSSSEITASQGYVTTIGTAGIKYTIVSLNSDKIGIEANIYYQGQYSATIQANVINAIKAFFITLSQTNFNGSLKVTDIENVVRGVAGVNDIVILNMTARADTTNYASNTAMVTSSTVVQRLWESQAGYLGEETHTGNDYATTLHFIAE